MSNTHRKKTPPRVVATLICTETHRCTTKVNKQKVWPLLPVASVQRCSMTLTVSHVLGSNLKCKWPELCQILGFLYYSPVCSVSQDVKKGKLKDAHTDFGTVQVIIGVLNIAEGIVFTCHRSWFTMDKIAQGPFWLGSGFIVAGIVCIFSARFPSFYMLIIGMILNIVGAALAIKAVMLYSADLANDHTGYCESYNSSYYSHYGYGYRTPSSEISMKQEICQYYRNLVEIIFRGLDIIMIVLSVLQLFVTICFCVLTGKALCKKDDDAKLVEDPELYKPLLEDAFAGAA
ncbi:hypothetical protein QQF64_009279 [Cirrhinus molitorella]|uniref:Transmembrane protein 176A n=1 Tax=Cirrhinus molitorella TaxID=172907 RepID=A0ABR3M497_9TELE